MEKQEAMKKKTPFDALCFEKNKSLIWTNFKISLKICEDMVTAGTIC